MHKYILDENKKPVRCDNIHEWSAWFATADRIVAKSHIGPFLVSTVFLGIDHSLFPSPTDAPVIWETMVFKDNSFEEVYTRRYRSYDEALAGHKEIASTIADNLAAL